MSRCPALRATLLALALLWLAGCGVQRVRSDAEAQMAAGDVEAAVRTLEVGLKQHRESSELRSALLQARAEALTKLIAEAGAARAQGRNDAAEALVARAQALDPANLRTRELAQAIATERRQAEAKQRAEQLAAKGQHADALRLVNEALKDNPRHAELLALQRDLERRTRQGRPHGARLLAEARPVSLDFREANLRTVLDLVSRNSGINFVLDKDIRADLRVTVYLRNASVEDALDLIVSSNGLAKKVLDEKTILVYPNTPDKQREFQEQVVRVFYLASAEAKGAAAFLKAMLKLKEPFVDERSNLLALRDSPEMIQLAERLIALYDTGEPEVMLDLEVIEVGSNRLTDLGIKFPDTVTLTPLPPAGATGLTIANLRNLTEDRVGVSVAGLLLNLKREVGDFEVLANPRVRAKNREKAKILIGNKVPVVTTTTSQQGFISDNISYLDVGLKLDLEPTVFADDDVTIKVALEVSSLAGQIRSSTGLIAYEVQTRNASTTLRLRDGETQLLAGLISREQRSTASRVPGAGDIPVLGRLFSSQLDDGKRSELVLAITPRVLRNVRRLEAGEAELWIGTESQMRLRNAGAAAGEPGSAGAVAAAGAARPAGQPVPPAAPSPGSATLRLNGPGQVKVGQEFGVLVQLDSTASLRGLNLQLRGDEQVATLFDASPGLFFARDGVPVNIARGGADGVLQLGVMRQQPAGVSGNGVAATLRFRALKEGRLDLNVMQAEGLGDPALGPVPVSAGGGLVVEVRP